MKINKILSRFLQVLVLTGSGIFTVKSISAEAKNPEDNKASINDRINQVREHIRNHSGSENLVASNGPGYMENPPIDQIWINIVPNWNDWNKLWNDWSNWNNWQKWNNWANFHRDYDWDHHGHGRGHEDHDRGHDRDHGHDKDHGHGR